MKRALIIFFALTVFNSAHAEVQFKTVEYKQGDAVLEGLHVYDDVATGKRPGVLVVHQWKGLGDYEKKRAEMLAKLGYNVFAADIYGKGIRPKETKDAAAQAGKFKKDPDLMRERVNAAFEVLQKHALTDSRRTAAIGYCFGGTVVLELARSGADANGVVSFHGGLGTSQPAGEGMKAEILALHGADDPHVPVEEVTAFAKEMREGKADWQLIAYGNAVHSFTDWNAGNDNSKGSAYNEKADKRSWEAMKLFFAELFK